MSVELLEKAFKKTADKEKQEEMKMKIALAAGQVAGAMVALALDATLVWAITNFMIGFSLTWLGSLGAVILAQLIFAKLRLRR